MKNITPVPFSPEAYQYFRVAAKPLVKKIK